MGRKRSEADFRAEIDAHLEAEAARLRNQGMSPQEALAAARRTFGNRTRAEERFYEARRWMLIEHLGRDLRFAVRLLAKDPMFSTLAVLGLALGIAVSTAIVTLIHASLAQDRVAHGDAAYVGLARVIHGRAMGSFSYPEYLYLRDHAATLGAVAAESGRERFLMSLPGGGEAEEVQGRFEAGNFLSVCGLHPALGRSFSPEEEQEGGPRVALLGSSLWKRRFAADPSVLGQTVILNAHPLTIVGVADARFGVGDPSDFYLPLTLQPAMLAREDGVHDAADRWLMLGAVVKPGVPLKQAQAETDLLAGDLQRIAPAIPGETGVLVTPGGANPDKRKEMIALAAAVTVAVSMILLIACSNLANLLLARAVVRRREIGVRLSLGAGRGRLIAQLLTESMLLALAGGVLGLVLSRWLARILALAMSAPGFTIELEFAPAIVLYALVLSLATGVSFGLAPAMAATRVSLSQALHAGGAAEGSRHGASARNALVIVPLALSLMLLLGAGVAVRRLQQHYFEGPDFEAAHLVSASLRLNMQGYDRARTLQFQVTLRQRIASMPGVTSATLAASVPLSNALVWLAVAQEGGRRDAESLHANCNVIAPDFFETVGVPILRGRGFTASDREGGPAVVMVNQEFVRRYWPGEHEVGKRIRLSAAASGYFDVIGVASDLENPDAPENSVRPTIYIPQAQAVQFFKGMRRDPPPWQMLFLARTGGDPAALKTAIRQEIHATDPALRVKMQTVAESLEERFAGFKTVSLLLSALGGLALLMASVGIYAILAYAVSQRTREIGIRAALGAQRHEILGLVMRRTVKLIACGIAIGLGGAVVLTRVFARSFAKFAELDWETCLTVSLLLAAVALAASYLPARKALRVDPVQALRWE
jgi:predicted permease